MYEFFYWLTEKHINELLLFLWAFLFFDSTRYLLLKLLVLLFDIFSKPVCTEVICPYVSVLLAGYNEGNSIVNTLESIWDTYPNLDIIVIDDGSTDNMSDLALKFARGRDNVTVLRRKDRGGKASALNFGYKFAKGDIILVIDTDSTLDKFAIWEIVQPFKDLRVGAVSGNLIPRNIFTNLITWFQAYEYLHSIFIGRIVSSKLGILGIVSGAFGAFRRDAWQRCFGMDVGPPEDLDFTLRVRKSGYDVVFAPLATCYTDVPDTLAALTNQRFRWEQGGVVRNYIRKHVDLINCFGHSFRWSNFFLWCEAFCFEFVCPYVIIGYFYWLTFVCPVEDVIFVCFWLYAFYFCFEILQIIICAFYSQNLKRDLVICLVAPLVIFYKSYLTIIRVIANLQELLFKVSYEDNYVPERVRKKTWHW